MAYETKFMKLRRHAQAMTEEDRRLMAKACVFVEREARMASGRHHYPFAMNQAEVMIDDAWRSEDGSPVERP